MLTLDDFESCGPRAWLLALVYVSARQPFYTAQLSSLMWHAFGRTCQPIVPNITGVLLSALRRGET
jgi:hypothetical protein